MSGKVFTTTRLDAYRGIGDWPIEIRIVDESSIHRYHSPERVHHILNPRQA